MTSNLYLIFDKVAKTSFGGIIRVPNHEVARRSFYDALSAKESPLSQHQGDYTIRCLGTIEETTGIITPFSVQETVADGQEWLDANKER